MVFVNSSYHHRVAVTLVYIFVESIPHHFLFPRIDLSLPGTVFYFYHVCFFWILVWTSMEWVKEPKIVALFFCVCGLYSQVHERYVMRLKRKLQFEERKQANQRRVLSDSESVRWRRYGLYVWNRLHLKRFWVQSYLGYWTSIDLGQRKSCDTTP